MNVSPGLGGDWHLAGIALLEAVRDFNYVLGRKQGCLPEWESEPWFLAPALAASITGDGRKEWDRCRGDPVLTTGEQESVSPVIAVPNCLSQLGLSIDFSLEAAGNHGTVKRLRRLVRMLAFHFH